MRLDPRVLGYLGRALSHEYGAVQQYLTHAGLAAAWGLEAGAARLRVEAREELDHAERLTARLLDLGAMPGASRLRPVRAGTSLQALLEADRALEAEALALYREAAEHSARVGDTVSAELFAALYEEERAHARALAEWIDDLRAAPAAPRLGGIDA
ncbi:ferritin-like domain-containing protein [Marichromatium gracile]|uniref:Bacterioferritin n=1 Tax=Marichromatium gracile TaxID=1048 RepID=A0A4R4ALU2_MARGR|nr:ferritin-like domain-containing protein [Marichromatium gracile]MBK1709604.1 bacterioferritin [Marichromatium gracile]TCW40134.1 bacterioferritin [Marichromatium gracile]